MGMGEVCDCQKQRGDVMVKKKKKMKKNNKSITVNIENFLVVQWLGLCTSTAEGLGSIPDLGTKIPHSKGQLSPCAPTTEARVP